MTLIDAGPLVALIDTAHRDIHRKCVSALDALTGPLITTAPCFTEAMYLPRPDARMAWTIITLAIR